MSPWALRLKGFFLLASLVLTSVFGVMLMALSIPVYAVFRREARQWNNFVGGLWLANAGGLLEALGVKVVVTSNAATLDPAERSIVLCNHHTRIDYMFIWCLAFHCRFLSSLKIILKKSLKKVPFLGWAMQFMEYTFLARVRAQDEPYIRSKMVEYGAASNIDAYQLLIFPEGSDLSATNLAKSHKFSQDNKQRVLNNVLSPRVGGWVQCMMAGAPKLDAVLDCTMGYVYYNQGERPSEKSLMSGRFPREVHIHVERHSIEEFNLPADVRELTREDGGERRTCSAADMEHAKQSLSTWMTDCFYRKEDLLTDFATHGAFPTGDNIHFIRPKSYTPVFIFWICVAVSLVVAQWCTGLVWWYLGGVTIVCGVATTLGGIDRILAKMAKMRMGTKSGNKRKHA